MLGNLSNLFLITPPPKTEGYEEEISRLINSLLLEFIDVVSLTIAPTRNLWHQTPNGETVSQND